MAIRFSDPPTHTRPRMLAKVRSLKQAVHPSAPIKRGRPALGAPWLLENPPISRSQWFRRRTKQQQAP